ncbi:hypothetical protein ACH0R4_RS13280 [Bacillus cytotoxicus]|uniref:hypothetical protein n=1 Tax=Bacillus cereus group sp. BfR-BA-01492 TaxID=2920361 RepID=UPI001F589145|nr:hypothetical protein [Bacillus cereus group sp. BfR-BA-01492]EMA6345039.1 hypothetical protein [Bacillus cytotoxicus]
MGALYGTALGDLMLQTSLNILGEPTTVLFRLSFLTQPFGTLSGRQYNCSIDMASWVHLLQKGKGVYIAEALSSFRYHPDQQIHHKLLEGTEDFTHLITTARSYSFLKSKKTYRLGLRCALQWIFSSLQDETIKRIPDSHARLFHCLQIIQYSCLRIIKILVNKLWILPLHYQIE